MITSNIKMSIYVLPTTYSGIRDNFEKSVAILIQVDPYAKITKKKVSFEYPISKLLSLVETRA